MKLRLVLAAFLLMSAVPSWGQTIVGSWNATADTPQGPFAFVWKFEVDSTGKLSGSMQNDFIGSVSLNDVTLKGDQVSFKVTIQGNPDGPVTISYTGVAKGDELAVTSKLEQPAAQAGAGEQTFMANRVK
jgi:hypothetical protein